MHNDLTNKEKHGVKKAVGLYTVLFTLASAAAFGIIFLSGNTMIWKIDGYRQHLKALQFLREWLTSGADCGQWSFSLGEGADVLTTLHYYAIGDPFDIPALFIPVRYIYIWFQTAIILRMYAAGLAFIFMCRRFGRYGAIPAAAGALVYAFCFWALCNAVRHPYFINPMIFLPLLVTSVEKVLKKERPHMLVITVFLSAVCNFYFFYMLALLTALYTVVRLCSMRGEKLGSRLLSMLKIGVFSFVGVLMSAVILLPMISALARDPRMSSGSVTRLMYPVAHYLTIPMYIISEGDTYWLCLGFSAPVLGALFVMLRQKKRFGQVKAMLALCAVFSLLPLIGRVFNGFSYACNRWCFALALLCAFSLTLTWDTLMALGKKDAAALCVFSVLYLIYCVAAQRVSPIKVHIIPAAAILLVFALVIYISQKKGGKMRRAAEYISLALVVIGAVNTAFWKYSPAGRNFVSELITPEEASDITTPDTNAFLSASSGEGFSRLSGEKLPENAAAVNGISSTQFYWSISNPYITELRTAMELSEARTFRYNGFDGRAGLTLMSAAGYYAAPKNSGTIPLSYEAALDYSRADGSEYTLSKSSLDPGLAYAYDSFIPRAEWDALSSVGKEQTMLYAAVAEDECGDLKKAAPTDIAAAKVSVKSVGGASYEDGVLKAGKGGAVVSLAFTGQKDCGAYLTIHGFEFRGTSAISSYIPKIAETLENLSWPDETAADIIFDSNAAKTTMTLLSPEDNFYSGRHDFTLNLGQCGDGERVVTITLKNAGTYRLKDAEIRLVPNEEYTRRLEALKSTAAQSVTVGTDRITAKTNYGGARLLCFSVPYSEGFTAYVDGEQTGVIRTNVDHIGVIIPPGEHETELRYRTPMLFEGAAISVSAAVLYLICAAVLMLGRRRVHE